MLDSLALLWINAFLRQCLGGPLRAAYPSGVTLTQLRAQWDAEGRPATTIEELRDACLRLEYFLNGDNVIGVPGTY